MAITFDGPTMTITLSSGDTTVEVSEIYSRWKDWVILSDNIKYLPAFRETGGDPLGGGVYAGVNIFIRNDYGWRIKPPEEDIIINLIGNLYPEDPNQVWRASTTGDFDTAINTNNSANLLTFDSGGGGGGGASAEDVWLEPIASYLDEEVFGGLIKAIGDRMRKIDRELSLGADNFTEDGSV